MKAFVLDTETTGLVDNHTLPLNKQPEIIEFYGAIADLARKGKVTGEVWHLIRPAKFPRSEQVIKETKTRINDAELEAAPVFAEVASRIKKAIEAAPAVIAHNLSFDMEMVDIEFERLGQKVEWPQVRLCTVEQTIHIIGKRMSLTALHEKLFNEKFADAHRAKADSTALIRVCVELFKQGYLL